MKKLITFLFVVSAIVCFANDREGQGQREMRTPPAEAISACSGKNDGDSCSVTTPRGDTLEGTCSNTPDGKYFACKPNNMRNGRPPQK